MTKLLAEAVGNSGQVTALDIEPALLEATQALLAETPYEDRVSYELGSIDSLAFTDGTFDLVWCSRVIHHMRDMLAAVREIRAQTGMNVCCSLGLMNEDKTQKLAAAGVGRVNHNLNTSREHHAEIVTTHSYDDRVATIESVKSAGIGTCSGGIIGMGESDDDIINLAMTLRAMDIDSIPVNFLNSIPKTPFEQKRELTPQRCLKTLCLFRFVNPAKELRVAGGREVNLRSLQPLSLYPANSLFVNGYLTTPGQDATDAHQMIRDLGFELDQPAAI